MYARLKNTKRYTNHICISSRLLLRKMTRLPFSYENWIRCKYVEEYFLDCNTD